MSFHYALLIIKTLRLVIKFAVFFKPCVICNYIIIPLLITVIKSIHLLYILLGTSNVEVNTEIHSTSQDGRRKRRRVNLDEETPNHDLQRRLIDALEKNSRLVAEQLEAQNNHRRLDRDQQRDQAGGFVLVLNKLADALEKIADKL